MSDKKDLNIEFYGAPGELIAKITKAVRQADEDFKDVGGSTRHWVRECLLQSLRDDGMNIVETKKITQLTTRAETADALAAKQINRADDLQDALDRAKEDVRILEARVKELEGELEKAQKNADDFKIRSGIHMSREMRLDMAMQDLLINIQNVLEHYTRKGEVVLDVLRGSSRDAIDEFNKDRPADEHIDYPAQERDTLQARLSALEENLENELSVAHDAGIQEASEAAQDAIGQLQARVTELEGELDAKRKEHNRDIQDTNEEWNNENIALHEKVASLQAENKGLRDALERAAKAITYPYSMLYDDWPDACRHLRAERQAIDDILSNKALTDTHAESKECENCKRQRDANCDLKRKIHELCKERDLILQGKKPKPIDITKMDKWLKKMNQDVLSQTDTHDKPCSECGGKGTIEKLGMHDPHVDCCACLAVIPCPKCKEEKE